MREQELETKCCRIAELFGWHNFKGSSRNGGADRIFFRGGRCFMVEFKVGKNKQQTNQKVEEGLMKMNGTPYHVVTSIEEMKEVLRCFQIL